MSCSQSSIVKASAQRHFGSTPSRQSVAVSETLASPPPDKTRGQWDSRLMFRRTSLIVAAWLKFDAQRTTPGGCRFDAQHLQKRRWVRG